MKMQRFAYDVSVWFTITRADLNAMIRMAATHYDFKCKSAVLLGGFIYGWRNQFLGNEVTETAVQASTSQLNLLCKICENQSLTGEAVNDFALHLAVKQLFVECSMEWERMNQEVAPG